MIPVDIITDNLQMIVAAILGSSVLIEIVPIKINPWSWLLKKLGNAMNADIKEKLDEVSKKVEELDTKVISLEKRVISHEADREEDRTLSSRRRILKFADECIRGKKHSKEYFNNVMDDITQYENYCVTHPLFKNEKCVMSIDVIKKNYTKSVEENDFL